MKSSERGLKPKVGERLKAAVQRLISPPPVPVPVAHTRALNLARKQANIRAVALREGFQSILSRSNEMARRVETFKHVRERNEAAAAAAAQEQEAGETIVMQSARSMQYPGSN